MIHYNAIFLSTLKKHIGVQNFTELVICRLESVWKII